MRKTFVGIIAATTVLGFASAAQAAAFMIDPTPGGDKLFLTKAKAASFSTGTVVTTDDVAITVVGPSDFADGFSNIVPVKGGSLTMLTFTPANPLEFSSFSFRGMDVIDNQVIDVMIQDDQGDPTQTITFTEGNRNRDFGRDGIIAAVAGKTIKSVEIFDSGGFEEAKQFEFDLATSPIPEPAMWALMISGFGLLGAAMRRKGSKLVEV